MRRGVFACLAVLGVLGIPAGAGAATIKATTTADQFGAKKSKCSLREATAAANTNVKFGGCKAGAGGSTTDVIVLRGGKTYKLTRPTITDSGGDVGDGDLDLGASTTILARGGGRATIDAKQAKGRVIHLNCCGAANLTLKLLRLRGGRPEGDGGAARTETGTTIIRRSVLVDNRANGGGLGGAISTTANLLVASSTIAGNRAAQAGAIDFEAGSLLRIEGSTISNNRATQFVGGGLFFVPAAGGFGEILNSTISGNFTGDDGGAIYAQDGALRINNSTIAFNEAAEIAGGVFNAFATLTFANSILAENTSPLGGPDCQGEASLTYSLIGEGNEGLCDLGFPGPGIVVGNPKLKPLADNGAPTKTHALLDGSPARNSANPADPETDQNACLKTDQRGAKRPQGGRCDMGAYERK